MLSASSRIKATDFSVLFDEVYEETLIVLKNDDASVGAWLTLEELRLIHGTQDWTDEGTFFCLGGVAGEMNFIEVTFPDSDVAERFAHAVTETISAVILEAVDA